MKKTAEQKREAARRRARAWYAANKPRVLKGLRDKRARDPELVRARDRALRGTPTRREKYRILARKRYAANRAECRRKAREYYASHKEQARARARAWRAVNKDKSREYGRKRSGLPKPTRPCPQTCEACGRAPGRIALALDHCHDSGAFRGWLCDRCNRGIGLLGDTASGVRRALEYLQGVK